MRSGREGLRAAQVMFVACGLLGRCMLVVICICTMRLIWTGRVHGQSGFVIRTVELLRLHSSASIRVECYSSFLSRLISVWSGCMHSVRDETSRSLFSVLKHVTVVAFAVRVEDPGYLYPVFF